MCAQGISIAHLPRSNEKFQIGNIEEQLLVVLDVRMGETVDI